MPRSVILTSIQITGVQIMPAGAGYAVVITYSIKDNNGVVITPGKQVLRYSSTAAQPPEVTLPVGMENAINSMLGAFTSGITTLEGL